MIKLSKYILKSDTFSNLSFKRSKEKYRLLSVMSSKLFYHVEHLMESSSLLLLFCYFPSFTKKIKELIEAVSHRLHIKRIFIRRLSINQRTDEKQITFKLL